MNFLSSTDLNDLNLDPIDLPSPPLPRERHQKNNDENNMNLSNSPSPTQHTHKKPRTKKRRQSIVLPSEFITAQFPEVGEAIADSIAPTPSPVSSQTKHIQLQAANSRTPKTRSRIKISKERTLFQRSCGNLFRARRLR